MSGNMFDMILGGNVAATFGGSSLLGGMLSGGVSHCPCCGRVRGSEQERAAMQVADYYRAALNSWSPHRREPGAYWTRTSGKTHRVEFVR